MKIDRLTVAGLCVLVACACTWVRQAADAAPAAMPSPTPTPGSAMPLSLNSAIQTALANNLSYRVTLADEKSKSAQIAQAEAQRFPTFSIGVSHEHTQSAGAFVLPSTSGNVTIPITSTYYNSYDETIDWSINAGTEALIGQAAAGFAAARTELSAETNASRADLVNDTTDAYFQLIQAQKAGQIADQAVGVAQDNLKIAQELFAAGTAARADVLRQQVSLADAQVAQVQADNAAALANANLANFLNVDLASTIEPTEPLVIPAPVYTLQEVLGEARARRPELQAANAAITIAIDEVREARSGTLPTFNLEISNASMTPNFFHVAQPQLSETFGVRWTLFDAGLTHAKVAQANAEVEKAQLNLQELQNGVDLDVRHAYLNYAAAKSQVAAASSAQASADENLRVTKIRYRAGVGTSLELSDALLDDTQAQTQLVNAQAGLRTALSELQHAAGLL